MREPAQEEYEDQNILKIELMVLWKLSSPEYNQQEQSMSQRDFGTKLKHIQLHNGIWIWPMSPSKHVQEAVRMYEKYVARHLSKSYRLSKRADNPFESCYFPKLDVSLVLGPEEVSYDQFLIGVMRWMIEIRQTDINSKVSLLSSYSAMARHGHYEAALNVMGYLKLRHNSRLMFDPSHPNKDHINFWDCDWTVFMKVQWKLSHQCTTTKREIGGSLYVCGQQSCWQQTNYKI